MVAAGTGWVTSPVLDRPFGKVGILGASLRLVTVGLTVLGVPGWQQSETRWARPQGWGSPTKENGPVQGVSPEGTTEG